ncbi:MAG TPA: NAD(P)-binding domain-containing protein [Candidatus Limnocylindria bacterium]
MDAKIERYDTVVIGGGQAGLAAGYHLTKAGRPYVIVDAQPRIGESWRRRWDSLRLFTPADISALPGSRFPGDRWRFPTKDDMAAYLERYAATFGLPVRNGVHVTRLSRAGDRFVIETADKRYEAEHVIVATGADRAPNVPDFATQLDPEIAQLHSSGYRSPTTLRPGGVLIVGAGNSGAEIALDIATTHPTWLAGRYRKVPTDPASSRLLFTLMKPFVLHVLTMDTPIGRRILRAVRAQGGAPVVRVTRKALESAGVALMPRMQGVRDGRPLLADGTVPDVTNVIWCTGFAPGLEWIDLPIHDERGEARATRGVSTDVPGLYFVGRPFQYSWTSAVVHGVGRDAKYVVDQIAKGSAPHAAVRREAWT